MRHLITALLLLFLTSCSSPSAGPGIVARVDPLLPADAVLLGEQHDAPGHQQAHRDMVRSLAQRGLLAAVVLEMAEQGASTAGLPRDADEAAVQAALQWNDKAWPWTAYGPAVMAAVQAGVPVLGGNLPRAGMRAAMADARLDQQLPGPALKAQQQAIRLGHCGALPESQIGPMTRVQVARDQAMARTVAGAARPGQTVLLIAGAGHVAPDLGVPQHLPSGFKSVPVVLPPVATGKDYCKDFRRAS
ncbi:MAG: ChaN family lipoprotein [Ramlibacter sp.]